MERVCNQNTSAKATLFYKIISSFDSLSSLVITRSILDSTFRVTQLLQGVTHIIEALFLANAILLITFIKSVTVICLSLITR